MRYLLSARVILGFVLLSSLAAVIYLASRFVAGDTPDPPALGYTAPGASAAAERPARTLEAQTGSRYLPLPGNPFRAPLVRQLEVPPFADATSVWGATGRDDNGGIWVGVSASHNGMSAHLMHYDAQANAWQDRGSVLEQLRAAGVLRNGEGQIKIHTKIIPADDGQLYFASTDEEGEKTTPSVLPRWGGHLWRIDPRSNRWRHLTATAEGLVAAAGAGRYVYALGYWDHVLYQYDTAVSRDNTGRFYVGGWAKGPDGRSRPLVLQIAAAP